MSDGIEFTYTLTEKDAVRMLRHEIARSKFLWVFLGVIGLFFAFNIFGQFARALEGDGDWGRLLRTFLWVGGIYGAWGAFVWYRPVWTARRWPGLGQEREVTATPEGICIRSALGYHQSDWSVYGEAVETDHFFLLTLGRANNVAIPKRELAAISAVSRFREFLRGRLANYRRA